MGVDGGLGQLMAYPNVGQGQASMQVGLSPARGAGMGPTSLPRGGAGLPKMGLKKPKVKGPGDPRLSRLALLAGLKG